MVIHNVSARSLSDLTNFGAKFVNIEAGRRPSEIFFLGAQTKFGAWFFQKRESPTDSWAMACNHWEGKKSRLKDSHMEILTPGFWRSSKSQPVIPDASFRSYEGRLEMQRTELAYVGGLCLCRGPVMPSKKLINSILSMEEKRFFYKFVLEKRRQNYLTGRYAAKKSLSLIYNSIFSDINIEQGVFNEPIISNNGKYQKLGVSISHSYDICAAITFPITHQMGIDIEKISCKNISIIKNEFTKAEIDIARTSFHNTKMEDVLTILWTIKESLSKVLRTGLMTPFMVYEISIIENNYPVYISFFKNFYQYKTISFLLFDYVCSITLPKKTKCKFNVESIIRKLAF